MKELKIRDPPPYSFGFENIFLQLLSNIIHTKFQNSVAQFLKKLKIEGPHRALVLSPSSLINRMETQNLVWMTFVRASFIQKSCFHLIYWKSSKFEDPIFISNFWSRPNHQSNFCKVEIPDSVVCVRLVGCIVLKTISCAKNEPISLETFWEI